MWGIRSSVVFFKSAHHGVCQLAHAPVPESVCHHCPNIIEKSATARARTQHHHQSAAAAAAGGTIGTAHAFCAPRKPSRHNRTQQKKHKRPVSYPFKSMCVRQSVCVLQGRAASACKCSAHNCLPLRLQAALLTSRGGNARCGERPFQGGGCQKNACARLPQLWRAQRAHTHRRE